MNKSIVLRFDLTSLEVPDSGELGLKLASLMFDKDVKFIPTSVEIEVRPDLIINESAWRKMFHGRQGRFKRLKELSLQGFNEENYLSLAKALHDLGIKPKRISVSA